MISRQLLIDVKRVIEHVDAIRQGRQRHELSEQEKTLIKEIYNSSYELHELLEHLGFGYRKEMPNKVSYSYDKFFKKLRDETVFLMYYWDGIEEVIRKWDEKDEQDLLRKFEYVYKRAHNREWREVLECIEKEELSREEKEKEAYIQKWRESPKATYQVSNYEEQEGVKEIIRNLREIKVGECSQKILPEFLDYLVRECVHGGKSKGQYKFFYESLAERYGGDPAAYKKLIMRLRYRFIEKLGPRLNTTYRRKQISFFDPGTLEKNKKRNEYYMKFEGKTQKIIYRDLAGFRRIFWEYPVKIYKLGR